MQLKDMTKSIVRSYIVVAESKKLVLEVENRKKARRIARKRYHKEYSEEKTYVIVSGETLKDALLSLKKEISIRTTSKDKSSEKTTSKSNKKANKTASIAKAKKTPIVKSKVKSKKSVVLSSMLDKLADEETKSLARLNRGNK